MFRLLKFISYNLITETDIETTDFQIKFFTYHSTTYLHNI